MDSHVRFWILFAVSVSLLLGCSGADRPATVPVSGRVTFQGEPLVGAKVIFMAAGAPRAAAGTTDSGGRYQLTMFEENDGAMVGPQKVSISAPVDTSGASVENPDESYEALMGGGAAPAPEEGGFTGAADLQATVTAEGPNEFNFDL